jgi:hypothetical protein
LFSVKSLGEREKKNANSEKEHAQCNTIRRFCLLINRNSVLQPLTHRT